MKRNAFTLVELLLAMALTAILVATVSRAFIVGTSYPGKLEKSREDFDRFKLVDTKLTDLLQHAWISQVTPAPVAGPVGLAQQGSPGFFTSNPQSGTTTSSTTPGGGVKSPSSQNSTQSGQSQLAFTTVGESLSAALLVSTDDFQTANQEFGPQGGLAEYELSTTAVGDAAGKTGLFLREQRPADTDPSQGGSEELLTADVSTVTFEYYDGSLWEQSWNTITQTTKRLPSAVRITMTLTSGDQHILVVRLLNSDTTPTNPVASGANQ